MRASWLSDGKVAAILNATCVCVNVDKNDVDALLGTDWLIDPGTPTTFYLLSPEGKLLNKVETFGQDLPGRIQETARRLGIAAAAGKALDVPARPRPPSGLAADALPLEVTARFLDAVSGDEYPSTAWKVPSASAVLTEGLIIMRRAVPTLEWVVLSAEQRRALLPPPGTRVGQSWAVEPSVALELLWRLRPPTHYSAMARADVGQARLTALLESEGRVRLEGAMSAYDPWYPDPSQQGPAEQVPHVAEADVVGYVDCTGGQVQEVELTTVGGRLTGPDGTLLPFAAVVRAARR